MTTLKELQDELKPYRDTLVLDFFDVVRLVGVTEDKDDFYWIFDTKKGTVYSSCVCSWKPLKGHLKDSDYKELVRVWNLNNEIPAI